MRGRITVFQWGYEGWGNAADRLVQGVDAVEAERGFAPPLFIDIRFRRSVRAIGFREQAFEKQLGDKRYRWMRSLGNAAIVTGGSEVQIHSPEAAHELLDLASEAAKANRRVIFFCSCSSPQGAEWCHRTEVAKLLIAAARGRKVQLETQE